MKRAMFIKRASVGAGDALLYKLSDPIKFKLDNDEYETFDVVVSAVTTPYGVEEACIFPSDSDGNILSMLELDGSIRGTLDHEKALENAGYEVI